MENDQTVVGSELHIQFRPQTVPDSPGEGRETIFRNIGIIKETAVGQVYFFERFHLVFSCLPGRFDQPEIDNRQEQNRA